MNQILYVEKSKTKKNKQSTLDIKKAILIFAITLIVFGISMGGEGIAVLIRNSNYKIAVENVIPNIKVSQQGDSYNIVVEHIRGIESITYNWNNEDKVKIDGKNKTLITEKIEPPMGNNVLYIHAKDVTGKESNFSKDFSIDKDIKKPKLSISVDGNYINVVATDDTEISYVTYRWNDEPEEQIQPTGNDKAKIETRIEIRQGENTLSVSAVDANNNTSSRQDKIAGLTKPTIEVYVDGDSFVITAKHAVAIERIEYTLNGKKYSIQLEPGPIMQYRQKMNAGTNNLSVQAYSTDGILGTYEGNYTYTPPVTE